MDDNIDGVALAFLCLRYTGIDCVDASSHAQYTTRVALVN